MKVCIHEAIGMRLDPKSFVDQAKEIEKLVSIIFAEKYGLMTSSSIGDVMPGTLDVGP